MQRADVNGDVPPAATRRVKGADSGGIEAGAVGDTCTPMNKMEKEKWVGGRSGDVSWRTGG